MPVRRLTVLPLALALLSLALPAAATAATAASQVTAARYQAPDGTIFKVTADRALNEGRATFAMRITPANGAANPYGPGDLISDSQLKLAGKVPLRVGSGLACGDPGISVAYGTVARKARRVVARLRDGTKLRLTRSEPPAAWKLDGWVIAGIANSRSPVVHIDAYTAAGKRIAFATFPGVTGCSSR